MGNPRRIVIAGSTLACAIGIGYFLQDTAHPLPVEVQAQVVGQAIVPAPSEELDAIVPEVTDKPITANAVDPLVSAPASDAPFVLDAIIHTAAKADELKADNIRTEVASNTSSGPQELPQPPLDPETPRLGCEGKVTARNTAGANIDITFEGPCRPNERVTIHHSGLMFTTSTDAMGNLSVTVPALKSNAVVILDFATGEDFVTTAQVPDLKNYDRIAVQWAGDNGFEIHAREFGAAYGDDGHVWSGADRSTNAIGSVVHLGDADQLSPRIVEVYSFPQGEALQQQGTVVLSIETEVTLQNCGQEITAQALELRGGSALRTRDMSLSMPTCSAVGDFLVLNNLLDDLKIAAN